MMRTTNFYVRFYVFPCIVVDVDVGSAISLLRSASENYQDYIPVWIWRALMVRYFATFRTMKRINEESNCESAATNI
jgi:hypothetical protein